MQFCTITDDGFVHYKPLMQYVAPRHAAAQSSIQSAINPRQEAIGDLSALAGDFQEHDYMNPTQRREFLAQRTCADMGLGPPFDCAVAFAIRRQLYRVALGLRPAENTAAAQTKLRSMLPSAHVLGHSWGFVPGTWHGWSQGLNS